MKQKKTAKERVKKMEVLSMKKKDKINWENKVENILKSIEITEADFKKSGGATSSIHEKVLDAMRDEWSKSREPVMEERAFQMDFVGRVFPRHGKIELAMEVDTGNKPLGNWVKLLDINATTKIWIHICREKDRAKERIQEALKEFQKLMRYRSEDKTNKVVIFMKVSGERDVKKFYSRGIIAPAGRSLSSRKPGKPLTRFGIKSSKVSPAKSPKLNND